MNRANLSDIQLDVELRVRLVQQQLCQQWYRQGVGKHTHVCVCECALASVVHNWTLFYWGVIKKNTLRYINISINILPKVYLKVNLDLDNVGQKSKVCPLVAHNTESLFWKLNGWIFNVSEG